jgi:AraC-like DNA-binding protein
MQAEAATHVPLRFSTRVFPMQERLPRWREFAQEVVRVEIEPLSTLPFGCEATLRSLPGLCSVSWASGAVRFDRTPKIVSEGGDTCGFVINCGGTFAAEQRNRELALGIGGAGLLLHSEPSALMQSRGRGIGLIVQRAALAPIVRHVEDAATRPISRRSEALRLLRGYLGALERTEFRGWVDAQGTIGRHIAELVALALTPHRAIGESTLSAVTAARLDAALDCIAARFEDPALTVAAVAQAQNISPRYLQRLLEASGNSFSARVTELRLRRALTLLIETRDDVRRISDIALQVGFSDVSYFNRLFRARFSNTPSAVRKLGRKAAIAMSGPRAE